jgi:2',3'-cyclic-nucleotide 2'-phosphodiesterase (5'-nucleotidase family)
MTRRLLPSLLVLLAWPSFGAGKSVTVLFEGDAAGEISPCGCHANPTGGLPRRKTYVDAQKASHALVLDSGNALFADAGRADEPEKARARLILSVMGQVGTRVLAVGRKDLAAGVDFLREESQRAHVVPLSANLTRDGKKPFAGSTIVDVAGVKVAVVAVSAPMPAGSLGGLEAGSPLEAVKAELQKLGKRDLTVVLAATGYADAMVLARDLDGQVAFVMQSGEPRGALPPQPVDGSQTLLLASGMKGQSMGKLTVNLDGSGTFFDLGTLGREQASVAHLDAQVKELEERLSKVTDAHSRSQLEALIKDFRGRAAVERATLAKGASPGRRSFLLEWTRLDTAIAEDAATKAAVLKVDPAYVGN